jgi:dihydrolipoamide dehydrogenase
MKKCRNSWRGSFRKLKIKVLTSSSVESADISGEKIKVSIKTPKGMETVETDIVLSAAGVTPNIEDIGLETAGLR